MSQPRSPSPHRSSADRDIKPNCSLRVTNIASDTRRSDLEDLFKDFGTIKDVYIPCDYYTRKPRNFAFVEFSTIEEAQDALEHLNGKECLGYKMDVQFAREKRKTADEMRRRYRHAFSFSPLISRGRESYSRYDRSPSRGHRHRSSSSDRYYRHRHHSYSRDRSHSGRRYDRNRSYDRDRSYERRRSYNRDRSYERRRSYDRDHSYDRNRSNDRKRSEDRKRSDERRYSSPRREERSRDRSMSKNENRSVSKEHTNSAERRTPSRSPSHHSSQAPSRSPSRSRSSPHDNN